MPNGQRPHLSSMMQDGAALDTDFTPSYCQAAFLCGRGRGLGTERPVAPWPSEPAEAAGGQGSSESTEQPPAAGQRLEPEEQSAVRHHRPSLAKVIKYWQLQLVCFSF